MTTHTPGPWHLDEAMSEAGGNVAPTPVIVAGTGDDLRWVAAPIWNYETTGWTVEDEANASLIAAAPSLLEALQALTSSKFVAFHNYEGDNLLEQARAAIAQALGEAVAS